MSDADSTPSSHATHVGAAVALNRAALAARGTPADAAPVRMVHLGLGAFHRAHQAWYTQRAGDGWGIAAFTGRSPRQAELLAAQDGLYALVERGGDGDRVCIITSVSEAHDGADLARLTALLSSPAVAVVTLTITEAGYHLDEHRELAVGTPEVRADIAALRASSGGRAAGRTADTTSVPHPVTALGRLVRGLQARRAAGAGPIAVVPCDNIPANGTVIRTAVTALADAADPALAGWVRDTVSFVSTSVDRITPANHEEVDAVIAAGWHDGASVVTEPFADWVLQGEFPAGRPAWENAGARFVDDIEPWETRKLWLLNGAHTTLVAAGLRRGHATVAEAFDDPHCRDLVEAFWGEAVACLPDSVEHVQYRRQLAERFDNPRIVHRLAQIAAECTAKVRYRIAPVARSCRERGMAADACARALAAWVTAAQGGLPAPDAESDALAAAASAADPVAALLHLVDADTDPEFVDAVRRHVDAPTTSADGSRVDGRTPGAAIHSAEKETS